MVLSIGTTVVLPIVSTRQCGHDLQARVLVVLIVSFVFLMSYPDLSWESFSFFKQFFCTPPINKYVISDKIDVSISLDCESVFLSFLDYNDHELLSCNLGN